MNKNQGRQIVGNRRNKSTLIKKTPVENLTFTERDAEEAEQKENQRRAWG